MKAEDLTIYSQIRKGRVYYTGRYKDANGKTTSQAIPVSCSNMAEARVWFKDWLEGKPEPIKKGVETIRSLSAWYVSYAKETEEEEVSLQVERAFREHILFSPVVDKPLIYIDQETNRKECNIKPLDGMGFGLFLTQRTIKNSEQKLSTGTQAAIRNIVAKFWAAAVLHEKIPIHFINPFAKTIIGNKAAPPVRPGNGGIKVFIEEEQAKKIFELKNLDPRHGIYLHLSIATGERKQGMGAFRFSSIKSNKGHPYIEIREQVKPRRGDKTKPKDERNYIKVGLPKKETARDIPLHPNAYAALLEWKEIGWEKYFGRKPEEDDLIFPLRDGRQGNWKQASTVLRTALKDCGVEAALEKWANGKYKYNKGTTRKTFATWMQLAGINKEKRKHLFGHKAEDVMDANYIGIHIPEYAKEIEKLPIPEYHPFKKEKEDDIGTESGEHYIGCLPDSNAPLETNQARAMAYGGGDGIATWLEDTLILASG